MRRSHSPKLQFTNFFLVSELPTNPKEKSAVNQAD